jgi:hypothetical protein
VGPPARAGLRVVVASESRRPAVTSEHPGAEPAAAAACESWAQFSAPARGVAGRRATPGNVGMRMRGGGLTVHAGRRGNGTSAIAWAHCG